MPHYVFRKMERNECPLMFQMVLDRMDWMKEEGIHQWDKDIYSKIYPLSYYKEKQEKGEAYVLFDMDEGNILAAGVLKEEDSRWKDSSDALYLHNFVSRLGSKGAGSFFLAHAEQLAKEEGKTFLRLDSMKGNHALALYYESHGYAAVGTCEEGSYHGVLREKKLK